MITLRFTDDEGRSQYVQLYARRLAIATCERCGWSLQDPIGVYSSPSFLAAVDRHVTEHELADAGEYQTWCGHRFPQGKFPDCGCEPGPF